jgi:hypothetical protein
VGWITTAVTPEPSSSGYLESIRIAKLWEEHLSNGGTESCRCRSGWCERAFYTRAGGAVENEGNYQLQAMWRSVITHVCQLSTPTPSLVPIVAKNECEQRMLFMAILLSEWRTSRTTPTPERTENATCTYSRSCNGLRSRRPSTNLRWCSLSFPVYLR